MLINNDFIDRVLEGDVSDEEAAEFQRWLKDPANLQRFALRGELHSELWRSLRRRHIQKSALDATTDAAATDPALSLAKLPSPVFRSRQMLLLTVAGLVTAACVLIALVWHERNGAPNNVGTAAATVVSNVSGLLMRGDLHWDDMQLPMGAYELQKGLIHLQFGGGVMVYVEAPARFDAASNSRVVLHSGRLSANVPPEGIGFTVETPAAEVVDFGTEFSVDVEGGASEVHVFDGLVRVQPRSRGNVEAAEAVDLRAAQAVKIDDVAQTPVKIGLATDRFIRTFDESRRSYSLTVQRLSPVAFYRMAIRDQGLRCIPPEYSGVVLTGHGNRPPHASGFFSGGSLRVLADSSGRGGLVESPPPLQSGKFTLAAFVYLENRASNAIVATNIQGDEGSFELALNESGFLQATIRDAGGILRSVSTESLLPLRTWCHIVMTVDGDHLRLYNDGRLVASSLSAPLADNNGKSLWFGTDSSGLHLWDGRIDEVALFEAALSNAEIAELYQAALEEIAKPE